MIAGHSLKTVSRYDFKCCMQQSFINVFTPKCRKYGRISHKKRIFGHLLSEVPAGKFAFIERAKGKSICIQLFSKFRKLCAFLFGVQSMRHGSGLVAVKYFFVIQMPGGLLYVKQDEPNAPILLAGPAELAFDGIVEI